MKKTRHMKPTVRSFLDIEAEVDDEDDDYESVCNELEEAFIDDNLGPTNPESTSYPIGLYPDDSEKALDELFTRILNNCVRSWGNHQIHHPVDTESIVGLDHTKSDYPLWKVNCQVGLEEVAVLSLMSTVKDHHQVRSTFTRGPIRGSIYVEGTMNSHLQKLLKITPGIIHGSLGVGYTIVDKSKYPDLLKIKSRANDVHPGDWVVVTAGLYKGDVALVTKVSSWGAQLLLVPRIAAPQHDQKRKRLTIKPKATLLDPCDFQSRLVYKSDSSYSLGMLDFEKGLLVKNFGHNSFENGAKDIPYGHYTLFRHSKHPAVILSCMPRPREWCMRDNEKVVIVSTGETGTLKSAEVLYAEVERTMSDQQAAQTVSRFCECVPWYDIQKCISIGQYVRVNGGLQVGKSGWVVDVCSEVTTIAVKNSDGSVINKEDSVKLIEVLTNAVEIVDPPFTFSCPQTLETVQSVFSKRENRHPWCGATVLISKRTHPRKGETGEIKDVMGQQDGSLKINIRLTRYNPSAPFQNITVDTNDVVEVSTLGTLYQYLDPGGAPRNLWPQAFSSATIQSGSQTPRPQWEHTPGTPAWDPSSCTPMPEDLSLEMPSKSPIPLSGRNGSIPMPPAVSRAQVDGTQTLTFDPSRNGEQTMTNTLGHALLNEKLIGVKLNVVVNGGGFSKKDLVAVVSLGEDRVILRHTRYHTSILLEPDWVTPKYPNPTHDNGLLVVIKGDHCGKYVRRIHHRRVAGSTLIVLAVMTRSEGLPDVTTGEQLELSNDWLCTVTESKKERDLSREVMESMRKEYRSGSRAFSS